MRRSILILVGTLVMPGAAMAQTAPLHLAACPDHYEFAGAMDYLDSKNQERIHGIEHNHLNSDVENLVKGQSTARPGGDIRFILNDIPNDHRALAAMMRLGLLERSETPPEIEPYTVRCWLHRATVFNPRDGTPFLLYGVYLARNGLNKESVTQLQQAANLLPNNPEAEYNLGLVYLELKDYEAARSHGKRAYELGFPLPGLKKKLAAAGYPLN